MKKKIISMFVFLLLFVSLISVSIGVSSKLSKEELETNVSNLKVEIETLKKDIEETRKEAALAKESYEALQQSATGLTDNEELNTWFSNVNRLYKTSLVYVSASGIFSSTTGQNGMIVGQTNDYCYFVTKTITESFVGSTQYTVVDCYRHEFKDVKLVKSDTSSGLSVYRFKKSVSYSDYLYHSIEISSSNPENGDIAAMLYTTESGVRNYAYYSTWSNNEFRAEGLTTSILGIPFINKDGELVAISLTGISTKAKPIFASQFKEFVESCFN